MNKKKNSGDLLEPGVREREWGDTYLLFKGTKFLDFNIYNAYYSKILETFGGTFVPPPINVGLPLSKILHRRKSKAQVSLQLLQDACI
jgi:hypothetical protein